MVYIYRHTDIYTHIYAHTYKYVCTHTHIYTYISTHIYIFTYTYIFIHTLCTHTLLWRKIRQRRGIMMCVWLVQFSHSVMPNSLRPHESQHARPPCPSPTPGDHPNSCLSSQGCYPDISSSVFPFSSCPQSLLASVFSNESTLRMRWPKYWSFSFSISLSKEHPGLISFRMDWLDLLAVQGSLKSLLQHHSSKASILQCSAFFTV